MPSAGRLLTRLDTREGLRRLLRADVPVDTVELARYLVGKVIVHDTANGRLSGRVVETEAYPAGDAAGHAFRGRTPRNGSLFLERGHAYVYLANGVSFLLNVRGKEPELVQVSCYELLSLLTVSNSWIACVKGNNRLIKEGGRDD
jgi:hypothetical protein